MVILCKNPKVRMSLLVPKEIWPLVVARMECYDLTYKSEKELKNDNRFVRINDIFGKGSDIMGFLNNLETFNHSDDGSINKIYILMTARERKKYAAKENGKEAGGRSEAGTGVRSGSDHESTGAGNRPVVISADELRQSEMFEASSANDDCD